MLLPESLRGQDTFFPHPEDARYWISGQLNIVNQWNFAFPAAYTGPNSFRPEAAEATSYILTLYASYCFSPHTDLILHIESAAGRGLSEAFGVAGFPNLDVVRNPALPHVPYIARAILEQTFPLSAEMVDVDRGPMSPQRHLPARRITLRAGKFDTVDFFDVNGVGSDTHYQFLNWAIDNNGAFDYAADTRGYTLGIEGDYQDPRFAVRFAEVLMPKVANGIDYDFSVGEARGENLELEHHGKLFGRKGVVRLLAYLNHARMGSYDEASNAFLAGRDPKPDITAHRAPGRLKAGVGLNAEQETTENLRLYGRLGWCDGKNESFAYTEIEDTVQLGLDLKGRPWGRPGDRVGLAAETSGLSGPHRNYLRLGGLGFLIGDGALTYGRETIVESYYTAHVWRGLFPALDFQYVVNPGFNRARGPAWVGAFRIHLEF